VNPAPDIGHCRAFAYDADDRWANLPPGIAWTEVAAVATDSRDRVFVFNRGDHPVLVFDPDGTLLASWGEGLFVRPHGLPLTAVHPMGTMRLGDDPRRAVVDSHGEHHFVKGLFVARDLAARITPRRLLAVVDPDIVDAPRLPYARAEVDARVPGCGQGVAGEFELDEAGVAGYSKRRLDRIRL